MRVLKIGDFRDLYVRVGGFDSNLVERCVGPPIVDVLSLVPIGTFLWPWGPKLWFPSFLTEAEIFSAEPQWWVVDRLVMKFEGLTRRSLAIECILRFWVSAFFFVFGCRCVSFCRTAMTFISVESSYCVDRTYIASDFWYEDSFHAKFGVKDLEDARLWGPGGE